MQAVHTRLTCVHETERVHRRILSLQLGCHVLSLLDICFRSVSLAVPVAVVVVIVQTRSMLRQPFLRSNNAECFGMFVAREIGNAGVGHICSIRAHIMDAARNIGANGVFYFTNFQCNMHSVEKHTKCVCFEFVFASYTKNIYAHNSCELVCVCVWRQNHQIEYPSLLVLISLRNDAEIRTFGQSRRNRDVNEKIHTHTHRSNASRKQRRTDADRIGIDHITSQQRRQRRQQRRQHQRIATLSAQLAS